MKQTLEEAAHSFAESRSSGSAFPAYYQGFIAGAEWQKDISLELGLLKDKVAFFEEVFGIRLVLRRKGRA